MVFIAKLELPMFIPKEKILGKYVFDSELVCIGLVKNWTYSSNGIVEMVVEMENKAEKAPILIPFSHIEKVGQFIMLNVKGTEFTVSKKAETPNENERKD